MFEKYKSTDVNFEFQEGNENLIVFLHGWGTKIQLMKPLGNFFLEQSKLYIDFPPFGESSNPNEPFVLDDYARMTEKIIKKVAGNKNIILVGHSFGGRVAIKIASTNFQVCKIILLSSAGLKMPTLKTKINVVKYKILKKLNSQKAEKMGSSDYVSLSPIMKKTFVNIINEDLSKNCKNISAPTILIYGSLDTETPPKMAKKLNKLIQKSKLFMIKGGDHFCYLSRIYEVVAIMKTFVAI